MGRIILFFANVCKLIKYHLLVLRQYMLYTELRPKKNNCSFPVTRPTLSVRPTLNVFIDFETGQFIYYHQKHSACQRVGSGMHSLATIYFVRAVGIRQGARS